jgi:hypothetical protein
MPLPVFALLCRDKRFAPPWARAVRDVAELGMAGRDICCESRHFDLETWISVTGYATRSALP